MASKKRSLKVLGLGVIAVLAFSAVLASAASARSWYISGAKLANNTPREVECTVPGGGGGFELTTKVGEITVVMKATGVDCVKPSVIENNGAGLGVDSGTIKFTGVTVEKPKTCSVSGGTITTNALKSELIEPSGDKVNGYDLFKPASGTEFVTITILGGTCAVAGSYPVKGEIAGKGNTWGTEVACQPLAFSPTVDSTTGKHLTFGGEPATLSGTLDFCLINGAGETTGESFGAK